MKTKMQKYAKGGQKSSKKNSNVAKPNTSKKPNTPTKPTTGNVIKKGVLGQRNYPVKVGNTTPATIGSNLPAKTNTGIVKTGGKITEKAVKSGIGKTLLKGAGKVLGKLAGPAGIAMTAYDVYSSSQEAGKKLAKKEKERQDGIKNAKKAYGDKPGSKSPVAKRTLIKGKDDAYKMKTSLKDGTYIETKVNKKGNKSMSVTNPKTGSKTTKSTSIGKDEITYKKLTHRKKDGSEDVKASKYYPSTSKGKLGKHIETERSGTDAKGGILYASNQKADKSGASGYLGRGNFKEWDKTGKTIKDTSAYNSKKKITETKSGGSANNKGTAKDNKPKPSTTPKTQTVAELWREKTGTSWSEAKKQGLSDGSAKSNLELAKKLKAGTITKASLSAKSDVGKLTTKPLQTIPTQKTETNLSKPTTPTMTGMSGSGMGAMERQKKKDEEMGVPTMRRGGIIKTSNMKKMKTGGMVNPNAKLQAAKTASTKGVMSGVNPKAAASKVAKGRSGGTSTAPKTAVPKAKYGMSMTKMKKK